jgi:hypothetical protein
VDRIRQRTGRIGLGFFGSESWLVTMTAPMPPLPGLVVAESSARIVPPGVKLLSRSIEGGALIDTPGQTFPGLQVEWSDTRFREAPRQGKNAEAGGDLS